MTTSKGRSDKRPGQIVKLRGWARPKPPSDLLESIRPAFASSMQLADWVRGVFIDESAPLVNEEHAHLRVASIGFLWTNVGNSRQGRQVIGQAETGGPGGSMGKWAKARAEFQIEGWFGEVPDFIITIDAHYAMTCGDAEWCALVEHELSHCGQALDEFGAPKFTRAGRPVFAMRGHDVETFIGVAKRYGAVEAGVRDLVSAVNRGPLIAEANIREVCGSCRARKIA